MLTLDEQRTEPAPSERTVPRHGERAGWRPSRSFVITAGIGVLASAWALWSALETGRTRGLVLCAVLLGLAFQTKMLQAFIVLPVFAGVYLWAGRPRLRARLLQLVGAGGALLLSAGWWVAIVE